MDTFNMNRDSIFKYALETFNSKPEYLWMSDPTAAILRHRENSKWYALIMNISKLKLGLKDDEKIDVLVVKSDPAIVGSLLLTKKYFPAYHMNKQHWISIPLDGSVEDSEILGLVNFSFEKTLK